MSKSLKEKAEDADLNVVAVARLFLAGLAPKWALQEAVDQQEVIYGAWAKDLDRRKGKLCESEP